MLSKARNPGKKFIIPAAITLCTFLGTSIHQIAAAAESGCVTCHLDKEMLIKTGKVEKGTKSALQSGAG
jgi:hypothetical protein